MKTLRILAISHMFPTVRAGQYGAFICREAQSLRPHEIECCFLVGRPWAPWPLHYVPRWRDYGPSNPLAVPDGLSARPVAYFRPPGFGFRRFEGNSLARALLPAAREWHRESPFDLVLGVSMLPDTEAAVVIARELGLPVAALAVGSDVMVYPDRMPVLWRRLCEMLEQVDLPVGVSQSICRRLAETGKCRREPLCVYLGRDAKRFVPAENKDRLRDQLGWPPESIVAICVGGLVETKGIAELAAAAEPLLNRYERLHLVCVGAGPARDELVALRNRLGREGAVVLPGRVAPEEVPRFLQAADFLVLPSHSEGMPQAVLEAMNCGLPVVATRVGGVPEAVLDGETGLLVAPKNIEQLRHAMERMIADEALRLTAGQKGLARAREVFDSERNARVFAEALWSLGRGPKMMGRSTAPPRAKVCMMTSVHIPFDGRIFHRAAKSLAQAGYEVVLIARHDREEIVGGVRVVPLPPPKNRLYRMTRVLWRLYRLAVQENADVYHFHDPELMIPGLLLKRRGKKVIWDAHEHYPNSILDKYYLPQPLRRLISKLFDLWERAVVRFFDYVIYTTPFVGQRYQTMKVRSGPVENYPIVKLSETFPRDPQPRILYLGGMARIRGLVEVVEAFALVAQKHPDWELFLVGLSQPASFEQELRDLAVKLGVEANVKFVAWVPYEEKERLSAQASMGVITYLPYPNNTSCLPNKLFDYMLMGLPVVASNFPLYRDVVETHRCGLTVDPARPQEIARALAYLIEHPQEARQMGENGRRAVLETYNWEKESQRLLQIYDTVLQTEGDR